MTENTSAPSGRSDAYDMIDRYLRNNLDDDDYAEYSAALDCIYDAPPANLLSNEEIFTLWDKAYEGVDLYDRPSLTGIPWIALQQLFAEKNGLNL